ncbi:MAG: phosphatase PAP2 family protein [Chitinophagaceae bacterium]
MKKGVRNIWQKVPLELLVTAVVFLLSMFIFSLIVHEAVYEREDLFDKKAILFFSAHATPSFIYTMKRVTFFGSTTFLFPAYIILIAWYISKKKSQQALDIAVIAISSTTMMFALKEFFHRQRPALPIIKGITGYSFPSGHSLSSFIFCSILIHLVWRETWPVVIKYLLTILLLLVALSIGLSRIVLNVHYATDVIGGLCLGIAWVILSFWLIKKIRKNDNGSSTKPVS